MSTDFLNFDAYPSNPRVYKGKETRKAAAELVELYMQRANCTTCPVLIVTEGPHTSDLWRVAVKDVKFTALIMSLDLLEELTSDDDLSRFVVVFDSLGNYEETVKEFKPRIMSVVKRSPRLVIMSSNVHSKESASVYSDLVADTQQQLKLSVVHASPASLFIKSSQVQLHKVCAGSIDVLLIDAWARNATWPAYAVYKGKVYKRGLSIAIDDSMSVMGYLGDVFGAREYIYVGLVQAGDSIAHSKGVQRLENALRFD